MHQVTRRCALSIAAGATALVAAVPAGAATPAPAPPSAIANEVVPAVTVSPAYARTGLAVAMSYGSGSSCGQDCVHLWATHDRGASWSRLAAKGWQHGIPQIAVGPGGREVLLAGGNAVQRSDDGGASWRDINAQGAPTAGPPFTADGTMVIAGQGGQDVVVRGSGGTSNVSGSGGAASDVQFAYAPGYPSGGRYAPLLLSSVNTKTNTAMIEQCTADYACSSPALLPAEKMAPTATLVMSPGWAEDGTVFAIEPDAFFRSTDGGHTFSPITIGEVGAAATSVGSLVLDADFPHSHVAWAAVLQIISGRPATAGGVYRSGDGGTTWKKVGSPGPMDHGATSVAATSDGRLFAGYMDQLGGGRAGLLCWDGVAWSAVCGVHGGTGPNAHATAASAGGSNTTACAGCPPGGGAAPSSAAGGGIGSSNQRGGDNGGSGLLAAGSKQPAHSSPVLPIALSLLGVLLVGSLLARLVERRRSARSSS